MQAPRQIWLVNLFFGSGAAPTGRLLESLAVGLQAQGWDVTAIAGNASYRANFFEHHARFTGPVIRLPVHAGGSGLRAKFRQWLSFYLQLAWFIFRARLPEIVIVQTTPPFLHTLFAVRNLWASWWARVGGSPPARLILWNQDTYPDFLVASGRLNADGLIHRWLQTVARWSGSRVDEAVGLDQAMRQRLQAQNVPRSRVIPNWDVPEQAGPQQIGRVPEAITQGAQGFRYRLAYTGNLGTEHDLTPLLQFLRDHPGQRECCVLFVGAGDQTPRLRAEVEQAGWDSVQFCGYLSSADYAALLQWADWGLVALAPESAGVMSPSKAHSWWQAGKPVLFLGPRSANVAETICQYDCGTVLDPGDADSFSRWVETVRTTPDFAQLSENALTAARERHAENVGWQAWLELLGRQCG